MRLPSKPATGLYRQEGSKRIALTPAEEAEVRSEWVTSETTAKVDQDLQRRIAIARAHDHRRRYLAAQQATGEDYTDLIARCIEEIVKLKKKK